MGALGCSFEALRRQLAHQMPTGRCDEDSVRRQWWAALATLQEDFLLPLGAQPGVWLASPLPALYEPSLLQQFQGWVWAPPELKDLLQNSSPCCRPRRPRRPSVVAFSVWPSRTATAPIPCWC